MLSMSPRMPLASVRYSIFLGSWPISPLPTAFETQFIALRVQFSPFGLLLATAMLALPFGETLGRALLHIIAHLLFVRQRRVLERLARPLGRSRGTVIFSQNHTCRRCAEADRHHILCPIVRQRHHAQVNVDRLVGPGRVDGLRKMERFDGWRGRCRQR